MQHDSKSQQSLLDQDKEAKLKHFLATVQFLSFSDTGLKNVASRFNLSIEELKTRISEFEAKR